MKRRALGKGLDALLSLPDAAESTGTSEQLRELPVDLIVRSRYQPRLEIDSQALADLAASIRTQGVMQPIVVRPLPASDNYEIIAGERRWRATQAAGLHVIPALVKDVPDQTAICMALIENIQRENLNPLDEALAFSRLLNEFNMTHETVAAAVGKSRPTVSNLLRLLSLHPEVQQLLKAGQLDMGHARTLLAVPESKQIEIAHKIVRQGLSVRATERLVKQQKINKSEAPDNPNLRSLQQSLSERLGAAVAIKHAKSGKGKVEIKYNSLTELDGILAKIK